MAKVVEDVFCPMLKRIIELGYCCELQWIADDSIIPTEDEKYLTEDDYAICKQCKKRIDPSL